MERTALVTGGAGGIGRAICAGLAGAGYRVFLADREPTATESAVEGLPGAGHRAVAFDVSSETAVEAAFDALEADGAVDTLVTAAGLLLLEEDGSRRPIVDTSLEDWTRTEAVNARGTFLPVRAFLRRRTARPVPVGRIVTVSSVAAQLGGYRASSAYIASKAAVLGFTKAAAREAAPLGITVNAVAPGLIDAPMLRMSLPEGQEQAASAAIPLGRIGTGEDVAAAVVFLASEAAGYLTGVTVDVNGGYRMQ